MNKKIYFFGDSFIGPFNLLHDKNPNIIVTKYTGITAKGLTKIDNENRKDILNKIKKITNNDCVFFNFGQVDTNFSFFYKLEKNYSTLPDYKLFVKPIVKAYVKFISELPIKNKHIILVYPSTIKDNKEFVLSLIKYKIFSDNDVRLNMILNITFEYRQKIIKYFNNCIKYYANKYDIAIIDIWPSIMKNKYEVKDEFVNTISKYSIHLLFEPLLLEIIKINAFTDCGISKNDLPEITDSLNKYKQVRKLYDNK